MVRLAPSMTMLITELAKATGEVPGSNPGGPIYSHKHRFRCINSEPNLHCKEKKYLCRVKALSASGFFYSLFEICDADNITASMPEARKISKDAASRDQ